MFCPVCGQQQVSEETRFCSRCGFLLTGIEHVVANGGNLPFVQNQVGRYAKRNRGLKHGVFVLLLTFLFVPLVAIISLALDADPAATAITAFLFFVGGLLRMAYALLFESDNPAAVNSEQNTAAAPGLLNKPANAKALPSQQSYPADSYVRPAGSWRQTNDLVQPGSVTDPTTKFLHKDR